MNVKVQLCRMFLCHSDKKIAASVRFHKKILEAVASRDAQEAERLLRKHIIGK